MTSDVVTDIQTGKEHYDNGNYFWAAATWILMFLPALLSFAMEIMMNSFKESLIKILGHLPLCQVWYHFKVLIKLRQLRNDMMTEIDFYSNLDFDNLPHDIKDQLKARSKQFCEAKKEFNIIMSDLQTQKLYEGFAESAPQACLQIAIILNQGKTSEIQLAGIAISLLSLSLSATDIYLTMPTKGKEYKEATWKPKFLIVLPCMMALVIPRLIAISFITSYVKQWVFAFVFLMVAMNCLINYVFLKRDPPKAILGCLTNVFAPAIVIEDGSRFYLKSALVSNLLHVLSLITLTSLVTSGGLDSTSLLIPCNKSQPAIFNCFGSQNLGDNFTMTRCQIPSEIFAI